MEDSAVKTPSTGAIPPDPVQTDLLVIGTGPAGASLACFLASHGLTGIMLSSASSTSDTPRAHITNPAALECLRDIGLEEICVQTATKGDCMMHTRWCHDLTGEEYARIYSWGNDPKRKGDYDSASPCSHVDLPQTEFEPIIVRHATLKGWTTRFNTTLLGFERDENGVITSRVRDDLAKVEYQIRSTYLFGADGARSQVLRELKIPLIKKPGQGLALNVLVKVDLSDYVDTRKGNLHWVFQPEQEYPDWAWSGLIRMVKPWTEWMFILFPIPGKEWKEPSTEQYAQRCKEIVGNPNLPLEVLGVSKWYINEIIAEYYSDGNIFCLGDAVHRHPPFNGLGSNTCVQDGFNLAWKIAYVSNGLAGPQLLDSFSKERQPVGHSVITRANQGIRDHMPVWDALGVSATQTIEERMKIHDELKEASPQGAKRRATLRKAVQGTSHEFHAIGQEMNQRYVSDAIYLRDEHDQGRPPPSVPEDPILEHRVSTYPGSRLPHVWLNTRSPGKQFSSIDLAGHGVFCLLTGIGGEEWKKAAQLVTQKTGLEIRSYSLGWCQDYEDVYGDWVEKREVEEDGCLLVRPDRFVAWRSMKMVPDCRAKLAHVLETVLARHDGREASEEKSA